MKLCVCSGPEVRALTCVHGRMCLDSVGVRATWGHHAWSAIRAERASAQRSEIHCPIYNLRILVKPTVMGLQSHNPWTDGGGWGGGVTMLPSDGGESGVCVKLTMPALIPTLHCGVSDPNKGGDKKGRCGGGGGGEKRRVPSAFASLARCVRVCAVIMRLPLKLKTCRRRAHCGTHWDKHRRTVFPHSDLTLTRG